MTHFKDVRLSFTVTGYAATDDPPCIDFGKLAAGSCRHGVDHFGRRWLELPTFPPVRLVDGGTIPREDYERALMYSLATGTAAYRPRRQVPSSPAGTDHA